MVSRHASSIEELAGIVTGIPLKRRIALLWEGSSAQRRTSCKAAEHLETRALLLRAANGGG